MKKLHSDIVKLSLAKRKGVIKSINAYIGPLHKPVNYFREKLFKYICSCSTAPSVEDCCRLIFGNTNKREMKMIREFAHSLETDIDVFTYGPSKESYSGTDWRPVHRFFSDSNG